MASRAGKSATTALPLLMQAFRNRASGRFKQPLPSLRRAFSLYDQINVLTGVPEDRIRIEGCTDTGFIANGVEYEGSLICLVRPIPEILVLGCGKRTEPVDPSIRNFLRSNGIKLEAVDSWHAASTFNFLNEEGRMVAAAFLPSEVSR